MNAFDVLGDPVRRRILELLAEGELSSGGIVEQVQTEFSITQAAVSQHLRVLRDAGFAASRVDGARRIYRIEPGGFAAIDEWLERFRGFWESRLDDLGRELKKGKS
jgi:DNA-binding transcriptional ArsR family regulator